MEVLNVTERSDGLKVFVDNGPSGCEIFAGLPHFLTQTKNIGGNHDGGKCACLEECRLQLPKQHGSRERYPATAPLSRPPTLTFAASRLKPSPSHLERISTSHLLYNLCSVLLSTSRTQPLNITTPASYLGRHLETMASYQTVDHKANRNKTPTIKTIEEVPDDGKTPRPTVKVSQLPVSVIPFPY